MKLSDLAETLGVSAGHLAEYMRRVDIDITPDQLRTIRAAWEAAIPLSDARQMAGWSRNTLKKRMFAAGVSPFPALNPQTLKTMLCITPQDLEVVRGSVMEWDKQHTFPVLVSVVARELCVGISTLARFITERGINTVVSRGHGGPNALTKAEYLRLIKVFQRIYGLPGEFVRLYEIARDHDIDRGLLAEKAADLKIPVMRRLSGGRVDPAVRATDVPRLLAAFAPVELAQEVELTAFQVMQKEVDEAGGMCAASIMAEFGVSLFTAGKLLRGEHRV